MDEEIDLGRCCVCETRSPSVRNLYQLPLRAPTPGTGWGCLVCLQPLDGAIAVLCDSCHELGHDPKYACDGPPAEGKRVPVEELKDSFDHDRERHIADDPMLRACAERGPRCRACGCFDEWACPGGCSWIEPDLCSRCVA